MVELTPKQHTVRVYSTITTDMGTFYLHENLQKFILLLTKRKVHLQVTQFQQDLYDVNRRKYT